MTSPKRFTMMPRLKSVLVCSTSLQSDKSTAVQSENQVLKAVGVMSLAMISSICFQISSRESIRILPSIKNALSCEDAQVMIVPLL